jgi:hypothetical protein
MGGHSKLRVVERLLGEVIGNPKLCGNVENLLHPKSISKFSKDCGGRDFIDHSFIRLSCAETGERARVKTQLTISRQRFEQCPCGAQVRGLEALREPIVHRRENLSCVGLPILPHPQASKAECGAQFPR